jgi:ribose transport system permease protein
VSPLARLQARYPLVQVAAVVALFLYGAASLDGFSDASSIRTMLVLASLLGVAATGQTIVILLGGLDLSVPGFIALGNVVIAQLVGVDGWPFVPALLVVGGLAVAGGAVTGMVCHRLRAPPLVVTLGTGSIAGGTVLVWTNGSVASGNLPGWLGRLTSPVADTFGLGVPPIVVIWAGLALVTGVFLARVVTGRQIYAAGANPVAARFALVPTARLWTIAFALSALSSAMTGVLLAGFGSGGDASVGNPYLFTSLAAVIVGGTAITGARGSYWRTVLGAVMLTELTTILVGHGYGQADQQILFGLIILLVVLAYGRDRRVADRV